MEVFNLGLFGKQNRLKHTSRGQVVPLLSDALVRGQTLSGLSRQVNVLRTFDQLQWCCKQQA